MDANTRRDLLRAAPNPQPQRDYVVTLEGRLGPHRLVVLYVPDRLILDPEPFAGYLAQVGGSGGGLEVLAGLVLGDLVDALVGRWTHVTLAAADSLLGRHEVMIEDRQPKWDNPALLARISRP